MSLFCQRCGSPLPPAARFCSGCGAAVSSEPFMPGRRLTRPIAGRQIAGVCLALSNCYGWDIAIVRVLAVLGLCFSGGMVGVAYLAGWVGIPEESVPLA